MNLKQIIGKGWKMHIRGVMILMEAPIPDKIKKEILDANSGRTSHIVFIFKEGFGKKIYAINNEKDLMFARQLEAEGRRIIGYDLQVTCYAGCLDGEVKGQRWSNNFERLYPSNIKSEHDSEKVDIIFHIDGQNREEGNKFIEKLKSVLVALSIKNKAGFEIKKINWSPIYAAQPISWKVGLVERVIEQVNEGEVSKIEDLKNAFGEETLVHLTNFYGQITIGSKIISGFSLLESLFDFEPEHLFSEIEVTQLLETAEGIDSIKADVSEFEGLDVSKLKRFKEILKNKNLISKISKNLRISKGIADLLKEDISTIYREIKTVSSLRGKLAHSNSGATDAEIKSVISFIDRVLTKYFSFDQYISNESRFKISLNTK